MPVLEPLPQPGARPDAPSVTLTQVLALERTITLYGRRVSDLCPRGDLGLGLDPDGPVGFALVRGFCRSGRFQLLPAPQVLSVFGEGRAPEPGDPQAEPGERLWSVAAADRALRLQLHQGAFAALLDGA